MQKKLHRFRGFLFYRSLYRFYLSMHEFEGLSILCLGSQIKQDLWGTLWRFKRNFLRTNKGPRSETVITLGFGGAWDFKVGGCFANELQLL